MNETDQDLLRRFARERSEEAFTEIVRRHLDLVYSAARRQVGSPQLAEEVAQSVFIDLARNAQQLTPETILAAWLYQVARRFCHVGARQGDDFRGRIFEQRGKFFTLPGEPLQ